MFSLDTTWDDGFGPSRDPHAQQADEQTSEQIGHRDAGLRDHRRYRVDERREYDPQGRPHTAGEEHPREHPP